MSDTTNQPAQGSKLSKLNPFKGVNSWEDAVGRLNYLVGIGIIILGVLNFIINSTFSLTNWFYTAYFILFGLMVISAQAKFEFIENNLAFLQKPFGRGLFDLYVATLCFNFLAPDGNNVFTEILSYIGFACLAIIGLYYIFQGIRGHSFKKNNAELDASASAIRGI